MSDVAFLAAFAWRIGMRGAGQPAARRPSWSQAVSTQASNPISSGGRPVADKTSANLSGSLAARILFTIAPLGDEA